MLKQPERSALTANFWSGVNLSASVKVPSLHPPAKQNPTSEAVVFHQILVLQVLPSYQRQSNSDMTVFYSIFDLWFYESRFWGKTPMYHIGWNRTITLISLSCPSSVRIFWAHLCCCFAFPVLDSTSGRRLCEKVVGTILCHSSRVSVVWGPWLLSWRYFWAMALRTHLVYVLQSSVLTYLPCWQWMLSPWSKSQHHPRNTLSFYGRKI